VEEKRNKNHIRNMREIKTGKYGVRKTYGNIMCGKMNPSEKRWHGKNNRKEYLEHSIYNDKEIFNHISIKI
jgi:hypothetical protein